MCQDCVRKTSAAVSMSLAMTNPVLVWPYHQEQKHRAASQCQSSGSQSQSQSQIQQQPQLQPESHIKPSSASTYSESTTYSYDKEKSPSSPKQKRSMKQRIKDTFKEMGGSPTSKSDRESDLKTKDDTEEHGPVGSSSHSRA
ncbi:hypothetical protein M426DRAFT_324844 [Hypoxylon sp. CI-4A]|nr:hypothetical protein M426DRAFT_324844 [Hypoxylon sp. CI-4A]